MSVLEFYHKYSIKRLFKVLVRSLHLVGIAGLFGAAMTQTSEPVYFTLAVVSGVVLVIMEAFSGWIWFLQLRGVALYVKLLLLYLMHLYPATAMPCLIAVILISGFFSHAPSWVRYFSVVHWKVVFAEKAMLG